MSGGSSIDGNSIYCGSAVDEWQGCAGAVVSCWAIRRAYKAFVLGQEDRDTSVDLADCK